VCHQDKKGQWGGRRGLIPALWMGAILLVGCEERLRPRGELVTLAIPLGLPVPPDASQVMLTRELVSLGRELFHETRLSSDGTVSCASCHQSEAWFMDGRRVAVGVQGAQGIRNTPSVLNAVYFPAQFWDGRALGLEEQATGPIANPREMNLPHDVAVARLADDPAYRRRFAEAFGPGRITLHRVVQAIAAFERTLLSANSPFDRFYFQGEKAALDEAARRGLSIFVDPARGNCTVCHTIGAQHALLTDGLFHNLGVGMDAEGELTDLGRFHHTGVERDRGAFRTPSLRHVAQTPPYMHDGSLRTLREVVDFYVGGGNSNPQLDPEIRPLSLTRQERDDLVAFLISLTGELPDSTGRLAQTTGGR
jgi:cytochrome c peroxidase